MNSFNPVNSWLSPPQMLEHADQCNSSPKVFPLISGRLSKDTFFLIYFCWLVSYFYSQTQFRTRPSHISLLVPLSAETQQLPLWKQSLHLPGIKAQVNRGRYCIVTFDHWQWSKHILSYIIQYHELINESQRHKTTG